MKISETTREQKQYLILGAIVGGALLVGVSQFVIAPLQMKWGTAKLELDDLTAKVDKATRLIKGEDALRKNLAVSDVEIRDAVYRFIPNTENPLSWATGLLYEKARDVGVDLQAVSERGAAPMLEIMGEAGHVEFRAYAVRLNTNCSYEKLKELIVALQEGNPYLCVAGLEIGARPDPLKHTVTIDVEWPMWVKPKTAELLAKQQGEDHG